MYDASLEILNMHIYIYVVYVHMYILQDINGFLEGTLKKSQIY